VGLSTVERESGVKSVSGIGTTKVGDVNLRKLRGNWREKERNSQREEDQVDNQAAQAGGEMRDKLQIPSNISIRVLRGPIRSKKQEWERVWSFRVPRDSTSLSSKSGRVRVEGCRSGRFIGRRGFHEEIEKTGLMDSAQGFTQHFGGKKT